MSVRVRDLLPPPVETPMGTGVLPIRGIDLKRLIQLLVKHKEKVLPFFEGKKVDYTELVVTAPDMVAEMIAMAADAEDQVEDIKLFPASTQIEVLTAVWKLSVPDLKKLEESLSGLVATLTKGKGPTASLSVLKSTSPSALDDSQAEGTGLRTSVATP